MRPKIFRNFLIALFIVICSGSFSQTLTFSDFILTENLPDWLSDKTEKIKTERPVYVDGELNPFYLEADFNGDSILDIALFVKETSTQKNGILIIHGKSFDTYLIGAGKKFAHVGDDLKFIEVWKVNRDKEAGLTVFSENGDAEGTKTIKLDHPAISVAPREGASNLIIWQNESYVWLHTGD